MRRAWEGLAAGVSAEWPLDVEGLAASLGLFVAEWPLPGAILVGCTVVVGPAILSRRRGLIAHEIAHWLLRQNGYRDPEPAAEYVAAALLLPARRVRAMLRAGWSPAQIARAGGTSHELTARRIVDLMPGTVSIVDVGFGVRRFRSPWLPTPPFGMSPVERDCVRRVWMGEPEHHRGHVRAWRAGAGRILVLTPWIEGPAADSATRSGEDRHTSRPPPAAPAARRR